MKPGLRSLNVAVAAAMVLGEALPRPMVLPSAAMTGRAMIRIPRRRLVRRTARPICASSRPEDD